MKHSPFLVVAAILALLQGCAGSDDPGAGRMSLGLNWPLADPSQGHALAFYGFDLELTCAAYRNGEQNPFRQFSDHLVLTQIKARTDREDPFNQTSYFHISANQGPHTLIVEAYDDLGRRLYFGCAIVDLVPEGEFPMSDQMGPNGDPLPVSSAVVQIQLQEDPTYLDDESPSGS